MCDNGIRTSPVDQSLGTVDPNQVKFQLEDQDFQGMVSGSDHGVLGKVDEVRRWLEGIYLH